MSKLTDLASLAAVVPEGAVVAIGGFQLSRVPVTLLRALAARGVRRLRAVAAPNPLALDLLAGAGALATADCGFIGVQYEDGFAIAPALARAAASGAVTLRRRDVYDTISDMRTAAGNAKALADFALLHAQRGDAAGNLAIDDPYADLVLAAGSRRVLATVEEIVERVAGPSIAAERVTAFAHVPGGAAPTACFGHYSRDVGGLRAWLGGAAQPEAQPSALHRPVHSSSNGTARPNGEPSAPSKTDTSPRTADAFIVNLARQVRDDEVVVTGLASAVAMLAIGLAQRTHAPRARYINCIGAVNPRLERAWPTSVEPALLTGCEATVDLPEIFDLARDGGVDAMFFGAGQIDVAGNINLDRIGQEHAPRVRLPGPAGSPSMRSWVRRVLVAVPRPSGRNLVERVDVVTSAPSPRNEQTVLVTGRAVWELRGGRFTPIALEAGLEIEGLASLCDAAFTAANERPGALLPPTEAELAALRDLDREGLRYRLVPDRPQSRGEAGGPADVDLRTNPGKAPTNELTERPIKSTADQTKRTGERPTENPTEKVPT